MIATSPLLAMEIVYINYVNTEIVKDFLSRQTLCQPRQIRSRPDFLGETWLMGTQLILFPNQIGSQFYFLSKLDHDFISGDLSRGKNQHGRFRRGYNDQFPINCRDSFDSASPCPSTESCVFITILIYPTKARLHKVVRRGAVRRSTSTQAAATARGEASRRHVASWGAGPHR